MQSLQFVEDPQQKRIDQATKDLIDRLLLEKIPLAGIARVCNVSESWLQAHVNRLYEDVPRQVNVSSKKRPVNDSVCWRSLSKAPKCGRLSTIRAISSGSGLPLMSRLVKLSEFTWEIALKREPASYGTPCTVFIANVPLLIPISGMPMDVSFQRNDTKLSVKKQDKPAISNGSTVRYVKEFLA
jgi:hypothetical protein